MSYFISDVKQENQYIIISGFPIKQFQRDLKRLYRSSRIEKIFDMAFNFFGRGTIKVHQFFLPELVYLFGQFPNRPAYTSATILIYKNTWMRNTLRKYPSKVNEALVSKDMTYTLKPYQKGFINLYDTKKQQFNLKGYLLAFEQGLGKTFTSIALMHGMKKDAVIIVAPKSTLRSVWAAEIEAEFKESQSVWVVGDKPKKARFYIVNYESIDKLSQILSFVKSSKRIGIIVDECHNFRNITAKRVINLLSVAKQTKCNDIVLLSGTPIKALGTELIPTLQLIDPLFDDEARKIFVRTFGLNTTVALDILRNRLGLIMHRKLKAEVEKLPPKISKTVKIKIPNGNHYTLENMKKEVSIFVKERQYHYKKEFAKYNQEFSECIDFLETELENDKDFKQYLKVIEMLRKKGYNLRDAQQVEIVAWANRYEKEVLRPLLPSDLKRKFDRSKSVVKYVNLKIMGEVIGGFLNQKRAEMFSEMIKGSPLCELINDSEKKTICFTTYVDVVKNAMKHLTTKCKKDPIAVYGATSGNIKGLLKQFKHDPKANPLVATIQTLSTGVTLIEANTVIFLNQPWRYVDRIQAEDRVHRIGQDVDVFVYLFILDTGGEPNLSTRMDDIVSWSKTMFSEIVGETPTELNKSVKRLNINFKFKKKFW